MPLRSQSHFDERSNRFWTAAVLAEGGNRSIRSDAGWLVELAKQKHPELPLLAEALAACTVSRCPKSISASRRVP